ncbi:MAG: metallophosphoesterase [Anaerolineae bacterium]
MNDERIASRIVHHSSFIIHHFPMRILAISDKVVPALYNPELRQLVGAIDLVLSCGDLPNYYIDYVASMLGVRCFMVHGNHAAGQEFVDPGGLDAPPRHPMDIDLRVVHEKGLLLAGLDGCIRYNRNPRFQYTQSQMWRRALRLAPPLLWNRITHGRALDILVTHSPPAGIHDGPDRAHQGFDAFLWLMRTFKPRYLLHGHKHVYRNDEVTSTPYRVTTVVNVYPWRVIEI